MSKLITTLVIAALLLTGTAAAVPGAVNNAPAMTQSNTADTTATSESKLTAEEAIAIALNHAGPTAGEVTGLRSAYDVDNWIPEWEIEFRSGDYEYDYTIHAKNGKILDRDKEYDPEKKIDSAPTQPPATESQEEKLTKDAAIAIALEHAGLTADQVSRLRSESDVDNGTPEWEVEFRVGNLEYEYTIHAQSGEILEWDKEYDG